MASRVRGPANAAQAPKEDAERHERTLKAVELRRKGMSYTDISRILGTSISTAHADVWRHFSELDKLATEELEQVRRLEIARLDKWLEALGPACEEGDDKAIATGLRLMERRAKLLGLDAPTKHEHKDTTEYDKMSKEQRIDALERALADERGEAVH